MPKLKINDIEIEVEKGTSILQACEMLGIEIPRFCYHDRLSVPANCRMCLVEVKPGPPKPQASCALACADNMEVFTDSDMVHKARRGVMEMMLINHPLDCPICDQGGECDLQDQAVGYGFDRSRYYESKRAVRDKNLGPLVKTVMTRCIQCTRCIRFAEEIAGVNDLGMMHRGEDSEIDTFIEKTLTTEMSGNLIDVCPVGALTSRPYAFQARPWELRKTETIDVHDALGCNIRVDARGGEVMRILPRLHEDINEEWIDDRTRFACDGLKRQRLDRPYVRDGGSGRLRAATWDEALNLVSAKLREAGANRTAALVGPLCDVESMVALKDMMNSIGCRNIECRTDGTVYDVSARSAYIFNTGIAGIERADAILLVGTNPRHEAALLNARILKTWRNSRVRVGLVGAAADLNYPYTHIGTDASALQDILNGRGDFAAVLKGAKNPVIIVGQGALKRADGTAVQKLCRDIAVQYNMVREPDAESPDGWNGYNMLHTAAARVGAIDIGLTCSALNLPDRQVVYLMGVDDPEALSRISDDAFVIYQGHHGDIGAHRADVILPGAAYTEKDGLYVNTEGRVQFAKQAVWPVGEAREDWKILRALSACLDRPLPYDDAAALRARIIREWPHFRALDTLVAAPWADFGADGDVSAEPFIDIVPDFYAANVIARASLTMAACADNASRAQQGCACGAGHCVAAAE